MSASYKDSKNLETFNNINDFNLVNSTVNVSPIKVFHIACDVLPAGCPYKNQGKLPNDAIFFIEKCLRQNEEIEAYQLCECCPDLDCLVRT